MNCQSNSLSEPSALETYQLHFYDVGVIMKAFNWTLVLENKCWCYLANLKSHIRPLSLLFKPTK
jgi:hypothetical protein